MRGRGNRGGCASGSGRAGHAARPVQHRRARPGGQRVAEAERPPSVRARPGQPGSAGQPRSRVRGAVPASRAAGGRPGAVKGAVDGPQRAGRARPGRHRAALGRSVAYLGVAGRGDRLRDSVGRAAATRSAALRAALAMSSGQLRDDALSAALAEDGELLADEPYAEWAIRVRERDETLCQEARLALARDRAAGAGRAGRDDVLAAWQSCLDHDPASEEAAGALIRAYLAQGRPELAARVFERCRVALEQLGLRISPSLERRYAPARDPGPARAAAPSVPATVQPAPSTATGQTSSAATGLASSA